MGVGELVVYKIEMGVGGGVGFRWDWVQDVSYRF